jgi:hypothetical protein
MGLSFIGYSVFVGEAFYVGCALRTILSSFPGWIWERNVESKLSLDT